MLRFRDCYDLRRVLVGELSATSTVVYDGMPRRPYFVHFERIRSVPGYTLLSVSSLVSEELRCHKRPRMDWFLDTLNYVTDGNFRIERDTHHQYNYYLVTSVCVSDTSPSQALTEVVRHVRRYVYYAGAAELLA
jgi:hypothetical protein